MILSIAAALLASCDQAGQPPVLDSDRCDRDCLIELTDEYVAALLANDSSLAPLSDDLQLIENFRPSQMGQGLWAGPIGSGLGSAVHVPDPARQQIGWIGEVKRDDRPVLMALRLLVRAGKIVEAEHLFADIGTGGAADSGLITRAMAAKVPEPARLSREELVRIGASYYSALDSNDGSLSRFARDCLRSENGVVTAGEGAVTHPEFDLHRPAVALDCRGQIDSQAFVYIDRIENRRMVAADPQTGLVMGFSLFRHSMENLPYKVTLSDGSTVEVTRETLALEPFDLAAVHVFKISPDGEIGIINALGVAVPYGMPGAWE